MRCQPLIVFSLVAALLLSPTASDPATTSSIESMGCWSGTNQENRNVNDEVMLFYQHKLSSNATTPRHCGQFCLSKGLLFAALRQTECSCGASMDGMRRSGTDMCSEACAGDSSQRCGGSNVISVYRSTPAELTQRPKRCDSGNWTVRLNRSADYQPSLEAVTRSRILWQTFSMTAKPLTDYTVNLEVCVEKCERLPTCWSVVEEIQPSLSVRCVLLDGEVTKEVVRVRRRESADSRLLYSLAERTCAIRNGGGGGGGARDGGGVDGQALSSSSNSQPPTGDDDLRGGAKMPSFYRSGREVDSKLPKRCEGGNWTVRLNRSADYQPNLEGIGADAATSLMLPEHFSKLNDVSLDLCIRTCEGVPTCWSVVGILKPSLGSRCAQLDHKSTKATAKLRRRESNDKELLFSLVEWTCGSESSAVGGSESSAVGGSGSSAVGGSAAWLTVMMAAAACRQSLTNLGP